MVIGDAVRSLDPQRQAAAERLALLVERAPVDDGVVLHAAIGASGEGWWWVGDDAVAVRIDALDGTAAALHPDRIGEVVAAFESAAPLLDALESVTGWVIEPGGSSPRAPDDSIILRVSASRNGTSVAELAIAVPPALAETATGSVASADLLRNVPLSATMFVRAVELTIDDADALATGDLLILSEGGWRATLSLPGMGDVAAVLEPGSGALVHAPAWNGREMPVSDDEPPAADRIRELRVPVALRMPDIAVTAGDLAGLREGGTLPLGPVTAGLAVELAIGGRVIAHGEIVRLGDRFAVHVDRLAPTAPAPLGEDD